MHLIKNLLKSIFQTTYVKAFYRLLAVLILFQISRWIFYYFNQDAIGALMKSDLIPILKGGLRFDLTTIAFLNLPYIFIQIFPVFNLRNKIVKIFSDFLFLAGNILGLLANSIDIAYFKFNLRRSAWANITETGEINNFFRLIPGFIKGYPEAIFAGIFLILSFVFLFKKIQKGTFVKSFHRRVDIFIVSLFPLVAILRGGDLAHSSRPLNFNQVGEYVSNPQQVALVLNTPFSIIKTIKSNAIGRMNYFSDEESLKNAFDPIIIQKKEFPKPLNVVIIIVESYSEEASGLFNQEWKTGGFTPFLDSLRQKSFYSEYSFANGKKSIEALPAIWAGVPSFEHPYVLSEFSGNKIDALPEMLKQAGYHTSFFHGAPNGSMGFDAFAKTAGIEQYFGKNEYPRPEDFDGIWGVWDEPYLQYFGRKLSTFKTPFFSTVFTLSSHDPFRIPEQYNGKFKKGPHPIFETLSYTDNALRKFFEYAKTQSWYNNTLFVITADHTSSFSGSKKFKSGVGRFRIPIFFYSPGIISAQKSEKLFQQTDISPTILGFLGMNTEHISFGKNLLKNDKPNFSVFHFGNYHWLENHRLLVFNKEKPMGLYNFANDFELKKDLSAKEKNQLISMEKHMKGFLQQYNNRLIENKLKAK
ncbi:MAG: sulfatase-like hydrolase/transferase [Cytophagaceae bacterium]|nr:sulfatase-like hydrolase/transferase [Cytophagaceae bacterium]